MSVADLTMARWGKDGLGIAKRLIEEAEAILDDTPLESGMLVVRAWVVLNGVSAVCDEGGLSTLKAKIEAQRMKVRALAMAFNMYGLKLETDVPDASMALILKQTK